MFTSTQPPVFMQRFGSWINTKIWKIENYTLLFILLSIVLHELFQLETDLVIAAFLLILSMSYFFSAFRVPDIPELKGIHLFSIKLTGFGSSVASIGILFALFGWPGDSTALLSAMLVMGICIPVLLYMEQMGNRFFPARMYIRLAVLILVSLLFYFELYNYS